MYKENPKTKGSGIVGAIPQTGVCPIGCEDCFYQSGRSYLEPLKDNLPNMPGKEEAFGRIVRVNDGNDSNNLRSFVIASTIAAGYQMKFYNTSIPKNLKRFDAPVVLTVNPSKLTDKNFYRLKNPVPKNLMFVRVRTNTWNLDVVDKAVDYYSKREIPVVLTFMRYFKAVDSMKNFDGYMFCKHILNSYWMITTDAWERVMASYKYNKWVYSCGKIEGEKGVTPCRHCGNCLREYFATMERLREPD